MSKYFVQCELVRDNGTVMVSWIPEQFAVRGRKLRLLNNGTGRWEEGWRVTSTYTKKLAQWVLTCERDYLHQRDVSDV